MKRLLNYYLPLFLCTALISVSGFFWYTQQAKASFGAFIQCATSVDSSGTSVTIGGAGWTSNITAGDIIIVGVRVGNNGTSASVTSDQAPTTFIKAVEQQQTTDVHTTSIHYGINQTGAVKPTITISNPSGGTVRLVACEYTGSANTALDKTVSAQGNSAAPSSGVTATRTVATELQIGMISNANGNVLTAGSGFTVRGTQPANKLAIEDITRSVTGTEAADGSLTSVQWAADTATFSDVATTVTPHTNMTINSSANMTIKTNLTIIPNQ